MAEKWLTVADAGHALGMAERTLRRHISEGKIKSKMENGRRLVLVEEAESDMPKDMPMAEALLERIQTENEHIKQQLSEKDKQIEKLQGQLEATTERHDMIVMQLTRQLEQSQRLLEFHKEPWYRRWFRRSKPELD